MSKIRCTPVGAGRGVSADSETRLASKEITLAKTGKTAEENKDDIKALFDAVCKGDFDAVKVLIEQDIAIVNHTDHSGRTALHIAAECGQTDIAEYLVTQGTTVDLPDNSNETPLHRAAWKGHCAIMEHLIKAGANINHLGFCETQTPLYCAAMSNNVEPMEVLVRHGADINLGKKRTPLLIAVRGLHCKAVDFLLNAKVDVNKKTERSEFSVLHCAFDINKKTKFGGSSASQIWILDRLIDKGADMNCENNAGEKPLDRLLSEDFWSEFNDSMLDKLLQCTPSTTITSKVIEALGILHFLQSKGINPADQQYICDKNQVIVSTLLSAKLNDHLANEEWNSLYGEWSYLYGEWNSMKMAEAVRLKLRKK
ncbi:ankyrin repeat domain-containing protein [Endozoicomonas sp.]|uniref:ankyrin repeat domain-containing protein n=1 Tax=Endozoicomonas sp. TaxID=1892382 RepID=UPI00383B347F